MQKTRWQELCQGHNFICIDIMKMTPARHMNEQTPRCRKRHLLSQLSNDHSFRMPLHLQIVNGKKKRLLLSNGRTVKYSNSQTYFDVLKLVVFLLKL